MRAAAALLVAVAVSALAEQAPVARVREGRLEVTGLPAVIAMPAVKRHLHTGLTTTFALTVKLRAAAGEEIAGSAQIEVRYELWDEKYMLAVTDGRGGPRLSEVSSEDGLVDWWRSLVAAPLSGTHVRIDRDLRAEITVVVLPFSRAEQEDTRQWFLRSLARSSDGPMDRASPAAGSREGGRTADLPSLLLAASIGRRSLLTFTWDVPVVPEGGP